MSDISGESPDTMAGFETVVQPAELAHFQSHSGSWSVVALVRRALIVIFCGGVLAALLWFSLYLAAARIYQVDESGNVCAAYSVASGMPRPGLDLFQILLSFALPGTKCTVDLLVSARRVMVVIFWINWLLIALATGARILSPRWWVAVLGAATLAPLWDYGFEIRHDNLLLTGVLITWGAVRFGRPKLLSYFVVGMVACALQFAAFKAVAYTGPLSLAIVVFPPAGREVPRWKLALAWLLGALAMLLAVRLMLGAAGIWDDCVSSNQWSASVSAGVGRHRYWWPTLALTRFIEETPLISALVLSAVLAVAIEVRRNWKSVLNWDGILPEVLLFAVALTALLINPTPFLYNLVNLVPFAFLLAFRYASLLSKRIWGRPELVPVIGSVLVLTHLVPFGLTTRRHLDWPNVRQEHLIQLAESLTNPTRDPVFDGIGMVPTRPFIDDRAFLHTMDFKRSSPTRPIGDMLAARPAAVIIPNYRTDWLSPKVQAFIRERYVSLADDFWVLGKVLPAGGGGFEVVHAGRYRIAPFQTSDLAETYPEGFRALLISTNEPPLTGTIDGKPLTTEPMELTVGTHQIKCDCHGQPAVVWVGPRLDRLPRIGRGDHTILFANGY